MLSIKNVISITTTLIIFSQNTYGQDGQTIAGAQQFLNKIFAQGTTVINLDYGLGTNNVVGTEAHTCVPHWMGGNRYEWKCQDGIDYMVNTFSVAGLNANQKAFVSIGPYKLTGSESKGDCSTSIKVEPKGSKKREFKFMTENGEVFGSVTFAGEGRPIFIDWEKTSGVTADGTEVHFSGVSPKMYLTLPSEEYASRVAYAMEFLRISCDPAAGTGF